ncbi:MAG: ATP-dependent helicase HrpB, partial [Pseudomonadota bacterium]
MALPIDEVLPKLLDALHSSGRAVLEAPPGAGKTTGVPLALSADGRFGGRIIVLEPRRLAARAAAERMAEQLGEKVGGQVGYRMRGESKVGPATRIELVTEGVFTAMIQDAPDLPGIGTVIFDEFHERSLQADLGLALAWEARTALRPDLNILVMSATLDAAQIAALLDGAPRITAAGRSYPIETVWRDQPVRKDLTLCQQVASLVDKALEAGDGGILAFLPGEREIRDTAALLGATLPDKVALHPLYGALPFAAQRTAVAPELGRRKLVLATAIAETSLTIEDISIVIDGGQARRMRFDPGCGMGRLVTEPVSRAEAAQRRGRAGRLRPGLCFRNWTRAAEGALPEFAPPEMLRADLSDLALQLARWGGAEGLAFLTRLPQGAMARARALLHALGGLDGEGRITDHGQAMAKVTAHPRLAHMLLRGGPEAANLAALLSAVDPMRDMGADLGPRLRSMRGKATGKLAPILQ